MKKVFKIIVDIILIIATFLLMNIERVTSLYHEVLGIITLIALIIHIVVNFKWMKAIGKNLKKVNTKGKIMFITCILIFLSYLVTIITGILSSHVLFKNIAILSMILNLIHVLMGRISVILMLVHISFHFFKESKKDKILLQRVLIGIYIIISILIVYNIFQRLVTSFLWFNVFG